MAPAAHACSPPIDPSSTKPDFCFFVVITSLSVLLLFCFFVSPPAWKQSGAPYFEPSAPGLTLQPARYKVNYISVSPAPSVNEAKLGSGGGGGVGVGSIQPFNEGFFFSSGCLLFAPYHGTGLTMPPDWHRLIAWHVAEGHFPTFSVLKSTLANVRAVVPARKNNRNQTPCPP